MIFATADILQLEFQALQGDFFKGQKKNMFPSFYSLPKINSLFYNYTSYTYTYTNIGTHMCVYIGVYVYICLWYKKNNQQREKADLLEDLFSCYEDKHF